MLRSVRVILLLALCGSSTLLASAQSAGAATGVVRCKSLTSSSTATVIFSGCPKKITGGSGYAAWNTTYPLIHWTNGATTGLGLTFHIDAPEERELNECPSGTTEIVLGGLVGSDSTGYIAIGGVVKAEICEDPISNTVGNEPGAAFKM